uniref:Uncharacterized protein n=1 Tax=Oryza brachyantha TaxID=4533 RepID=J3M2K5_ORYBR
MNLDETKNLTLLNAGGINKGVFIFFSFYRSCFFTYIHTLPYSRFFFCPRPTGTFPDPSPPHTIFLSNEKHSSYFFPLI